MTRFLPFLLSVIIVIVAVVLQLIDPQIVQRARDVVFDSYQSWMPRAHHDDNIKVVDIDNASLNRVGQWPWSRRTMADLVDNIAAAGAKAIVFDMVFAEEDRLSPAELLRQLQTAVDVQVSGILPDYDQQFADAIGKAPVVVGFVGVADAGSGLIPTRKSGIAVSGDPPQSFLPSFTWAVTSLPAIEESAAGNGSFNFRQGLDGTVRRVPLLVNIGGSIQPTLVSEALRLYYGAKTITVKSSGGSGQDRFGENTGVNHVRIGDRVISTDPSGQIIMHYAPLRMSRYIPAWEILDPEQKTPDLTGAIVFVGTSAAGLKDLRVTALGNVVPGVEIHAQAIDSILHESYLIRPDLAQATEVLFMIGLWMIVALVSLRYGAVTTAVVGGVSAAGVFAISWWSFVEARLLLDPVFPCAVTLANHVVVSMLRHWQSERRNRWIRQAFSSYVSPNLVAHILDNPDSLNLGGNRRDCSFVCTDLANFTSMVETVDPDQTIAILNNYLDGMTKIAFKHDGTLDRIVGDAVAVIFSAPVVQEDHAKRAMACALEMDEFARQYKIDRQAEGLPFGQTRIGINTGSVIVGNFGGEAIYDYRALGDPINTAARLESLNKHLGTRMCVSQSTLENCEYIPARSAGSMILKGKSEPVMVYEPLTDDTEGYAPFEKYQKAFACLRDSDDNAEALSAFETLAEQYPDDPLVQFHLSRLRAGESGVVVVMEKK